MNKKDDCKACEEFKPQQPDGCEDLDDERNAASAFLFCSFTPLFRDNSYTSYQTRKDMGHFDRLLMQYFLQFLLLYVAFVLDDDLLAH